MTLEEAEAEFRDNLCHNGFDQPLVDYAVKEAHRIYTAAAEQMVAEEKHQAEVYRVGMVKAQEECEQLRRLGNRQREEIENINNMADSVECLRDIGRLVGCGHVDDADGRRQLVKCVDEALLKERAAGEADERMRLAHEFKNGEGDRT